MRYSASSQKASSAVRVLAVILLCGAAASCSSDVTRFNGIFSSKTDDITTNSVPHTSDRVIGEMPTPRRDVDNVAAVPVDDGGLDQPFPTTPKVTHQAVNTSTDGLSGTRASVTPIVVQKAELPDPSLSTPKVAVKKPAVKLVAPDTTVTGTVPATRWQATDSSPRIVLKSGETISHIARRYSVPEREIVRVNGLKDANSAQAGATIIIPVFSNAPASKVAVKTKVATDVALVKPKDKKVPVPDKTDDNVAILPGSSTRDKSKVVADAKVAGTDDKADKAQDGIYVVKSGDSLAKIARAHKTTVDALKAANGLETAQLRIGQKLRLSGTAPVVAETKVAKADPTTTASIPKVNQTAKVAENATETKSVAEAETSTDVKDKAPVSTGISKYRWPVRGAVVAGFGANVDGERNPGIDISVPEGTPVKAAENGVVIYSGAGLKELGNTVLIRHDDGTVTVYGNASDLKVARGQKVQRGQIIATSGMSGGAKQPKLHFEVRKNASPVNPMTFLE